MSHAGNEQEQPHNGKSLSGPGFQEDAHRKLKTATRARIALGRCGGSLPTNEVLRFSLDHASARDAVHAEFDIESLERDLKALQIGSLRAESQAGSLSQYLGRPDLGRRLLAADRRRLADELVGPFDLVIIVSNGLSARAANEQVIPLLKELIPSLVELQWRLAPVILIPRARVALQDEVGEIAKARLALILLGERPGLDAADSLGAYLVHEPRVGKTDADRNCVSNIRPAGQTPIEAAATLKYLLTESLRRGISGVELKDERDLTLDQLSSSQTTPAVETRNSSSQ